MRKISACLSAAVILVVTGTWGITTNAEAQQTALALMVGEPAPDFTLSNQHGQAVTLSEYRGKWVVLYFYPKDDTPGCTKEACSFRDNLVAIQQLDAVVLGVSVDSVLSHKAFSEKYNLNFDILSDEQHQVCRQYGTLRPFMGRKIANRSSFIIDPDGIIRKVYPSVDPEDHALEIHLALKDLRGA